VPRKKLIAANWKMYKTPEQTRAFFTSFLPMIWDHSRDEIVVCPPSIDIPAALEAAEGSPVKIGAQNVFWEKEGAYTGELSVAMIQGAGCSHVIIGHSERRQYFGETDDTVNQKLKVVLDAGLTPIMCIGEVLEEREAGLTEDILRRQCNVGLRGISGERASKLVIAYEPVWAIGTGKTATPQMAVEAHLTIRAEAAKALGKEVADNLRILYGGSVKPDNAKSLMSESEIDGALVGGASLDPKSFTAIIQY
jgi:triosephosphate isomerase (TIM)